VSDRIRLLLVDDSEIFTAAVEQAVRGHPRLEVVGVARDGAEAVELVKRRRPDIVSMDVHMPTLGGVEAVVRLMDEAPVPIVMVTGATSGEWADISFRAVGAGALDVIAKPAGPAEMEALLQRLTILAGVQVRRRASRGTSAGMAPAPVAASTAPVVASERLESLVVPAGQVLAVGIAVSTGGPPVLEAALRDLPADYPCPVLIVQHLSPGFDAHLAEWLGRSAKVRVRVARDGERAEPATAYLAPSDHHLEARMGGFVRLDGVTGRVAGHRPSGTVLLRSIARTYGARAAGLVLTGMGSDGAEGLLDLRRAGGWTAAQDAATSAVDGMPRVARESGAARFVLRSGEVASFLRKVAGR
jgi:two-component system chemotaxis response regulator CheB